MAAAGGPGTLQQRWKGARRKAEVTKPFHK